MLRITVADLIETGVAISHAEAAALTLAVLDLLTASGGSRIPPDEQIFLSSTGHLTFGSVTVSSDGVEEDPNVAAQLSKFLRRLLQLDERTSGDRRRRVPGPLLVTLARSLQQIDLPPLPLDEFRASLERFGTPDNTMLAAIFWRAARVRTPSGAPRSQPLELPPSGDRRRHTPSPEELRRYLREIERELYETRAHTMAPRPQPIVVHVPPAVTPSRGRRVPRGVAATFVGAAAGTAAAFLLVGSLNLALPWASPQEEPQIAAWRVSAPTPTVAPAAHTEHLALQPEPTIRTTRSVQPLLLAAAVGTDVFSPSFSPRGHTLLFHAGRKAAPLMRASMTEAGVVEQVEKLLDDGAANYHVTMSPDGEMIAYDSDRDGERGVYVAHADGTEPRRVSGSGYAAVPSWSPDGGRLAFVRAEPNHPKVWNVWIADVATGTLHRITRHSLGQPWGASWFPDGRRVAYSLEDRLMVADLDAGMATGYRSPRKGRLVRTPAVSPDGRRIVFQVQNDGVWLLDLEHARMRRILTDATAEEFVWSPEGDAIAYHARTGGAYGLWRLALPGGAN